MARAPLAEYNRKRDFAKTAEPPGAIDRRAGNRFIVQKHDATRLHFDFRLEADGVLKSWAVTRGPSPNPDDKRLAVRTEDHPISYGDFEGLIPKGEYGGGTVMLWDKGTWAPVEGKSAQDIERGHLHFTLAGERMKGEWLLVRMKPRPGEKRENWLLRKVADRFAGGSDDLVGRELTSVKTGRTMAQIAANKAGEVSLRGKKGKAFEAAMAQANRAAPKSGVRGTKPGPLPKFRAVQLATLVDAVPTGNEWLHEIKYDGYRCLIAVAGDKVRIFTRTGLDWTDKFPTIAAAVTKLGIPSALIDGEIVALDTNGNPSFSALQKALKEGRDDLTLFAFDLLEQGGKSIADLPLIERKERLAALIPDDSSAIRYSDHIIGAGEKLFEGVCSAGQEGIISKRASAPYRGRRSTGWLKIKCTHREEFVIIGWSASKTRARPFASLLLAQHQGKTLRYSGKVGTGFDAALLAELSGKLDKRTRASPPADVPAVEARGAHWVTPDLVAEVAFAERTADGVLRHPSFIGLRADKPAKSVRPEKAAAPPRVEDDVKISHPDRVIFPETGGTKGDLAAYYRSVGALMLPFIANRPVSVVRCPQGRARQCFFQKHDSGSFGPHVRHVPVREKDGGTEDYLYVEDIAGIIACVQMGTIEFHGWESKIDALEQPDRMVFDLDPDIGLDFGDVRKAARDIARILSDIGLASFPMLSGGKGVHVIAPLTPKAKWGAVKDFAQRFAQAMTANEPERFTATMAKAQRKGKIFIDWLRNQRGSTSVVPYAARARKGAPVAAPVSWDELDTFGDAAAFSIRDADKLVERATKLRGWGVADQSLPDL